MAVAELISDAKASRKYHALDGLRGIAAIAVVLMHYDTFLTPITVPGAYLAVDIFFLMSGFVIAHAYDAKLAGRMSVGAFMLARLIRLYPMYVLGVLVAGLPIAIALLLHKPLVWTWSSWATAFLPSLLMLPSPEIPLRSQSLFPLNIPAWSLFFELIVNFVFALASPRFGARHFVAVIALGALGVAICAGIHGNLDGGAFWPNVWIGPARVTFSFFLGAGLYRLHRLDRLPRPRIPAPVLLVGAALLFWIPVTGTARAIYDCVCVMLVFPALMVAAVANDPVRGVKAYTWLGLASYPLYAITMPVRFVVIGVAVKLSGNAEDYAPWIGLGLVSIMLVVALVLAQTLDPWVRRPLTRLSARYGSGLRDHARP